MTFDKTIPVGWQYLPVNEAISVNPSRPLARSTVAPSLAMEDLATSARQTATFKEKPYIGSGSRFRNGDTLFARITPCLENGKTAFVRDLPHGVTAHGSTEFIVFSGKENISDNLWTYYTAREETFRQAAITRMEGSSGRQRVPTSAFSDIKILVPPLKEQKVIAKILGALDDKIELNRRMNETLEAMARALFQSWFVDFDPVRVKARGGDPVAELGISPEVAALFPDTFEDSELGAIPKGWQAKPIDTLGDFLNGLAMQKYPANALDASLPVVKIAELRRGITSSSDRADEDIPVAYRIEDGDLLFSWSGSLVAKIWVGGSGALNQHLFKVSSKFYPQWFLFNWILHHLPDWQHIASNKATTMGHIQRIHLTQSLCATPPHDLLTVSDHFFEPLHSAAIANAIESRTLEETRDYLLPKLLSGEITPGEGGTP